MKRVLLLMAGAVCLATPVMAGETYIAARGGVNFPLDQSNDTTGFDVDVEFGSGALVGGAVGYDSNAGWRAEAEFTYRKNDIEVLDFNGNRQTLIGEADAKVKSYMANVYWDFATDSDVTPYVGVGLGAATIDETAFYGPVAFDNEETGFAYQAIAGAQMKLTDSIALTTDVRYFSIVGPDFDRVSPGGTARLDGEYKSIALTAGLVWRFDSGLLN